MPPALRLLRPKQWTKGLLVFGAPLFAGSLFVPGSALRAVAAFFAFALVSSATYVANDLMDVERDRAHPSKRLRPIASGEVPVPLARLLLVAALVGGSLLGAAVSLLGVLAFYLGIQVAYNLALKRQPVADVFCVASGFVLRAVAGAAAVAVPVSGWLLVCTGSLALMLGFGKRRHEFVTQGDSRGASREALGGYTLATLDAMLLMSAAGAAMAYAVYAIESNTAIAHPAVLATAPWVAYGVFRYVHLALSGGETGEPENLLFRDRHLVAAMVLFVVCAVFALRTGSVGLLEQIRAGGTLRP